MANTFGDITVWTFIATADVTVAGSIHADGGIRLVTGASLSNVDLSMDNDQDSGLMQYTTADYLVTLVSEGQVAVGCKGAPDDREVHIPSGDLVVADRVIAGGAVVGATFEADSIEVVGDATADRFLGAESTDIGNPQFSFVGAEGYGMYKSSVVAGVYITINSSFKQYWSGTNSQMGVPLRIDDDSTAGTPALQFRDDNDTGIYQIVNGGDDLAFSTGGTQAGYFDADQNLHVTGDVIAGGSVQGATFEADELEIQLLGTAPDPSIRWASDPDTGFFHHASTDNLFYVTTAGTAVMYWKAGAIHSLSTHRFGSSSALLTEPPICFNTDTNTGIGQNANGDGSVAFVTDGVVAGYFDINEDLYVTNSIIAGGPILGATGEFSYVRTDELEVNGPSTLDGQVSLYPNQVDISAGIKPVLTFEPEFEITGGSSGVAILSFTHIVTHSAGLIQGYTVRDTSRWISEAANASTFSLFASYTTFSTITADSWLITPNVFTSQPTFVAENVAATVPIAFDVIWGRNYWSSPLFSSTGASGDLTVEKFEGFVSDVRGTTTLDGVVTIDEYNDIVVNDSVFSGAGTQTLTLRNMITLIDETNAVTINGILSTITSGANKKFINHTGTAVSSFGGEVTATSFALPVDASSGGQVIGVSDALAPMLTIATALDSGISISDTHVKIWEDGDLCATFNGVDAIFTVAVRLDTTGSSSAPSLYFNSGANDPGVHYNLDNASTGWGWTMNGSEVGYFDMADENLYVTNSLIVGDTASVGATFDAGNIRTTGRIDVALDGVEFSRFGPVPSTNVGGDTSDIFVSTKVSDTGSVGGIRRGGMFVSEWDGTSASASTAFAGLNSFARSTADSTQDLTTSTNPAGSLIGGRYLASVLGAGAVPLAGGVASRASVADDGGLLTEGYAFFDEGGVGGSGNGMTYYTGLWIKDGDGVIDQKTGIWIEDLNNAVSENIGIQIDGAAQNVLWLGAGAANTDEANGIVWGAGRDVNLYRSDDNELTTDDAFVSNSLTIGSDTLSALTKVSTFEDLADSAGVLTSDGGGVYSWGAAAAANTARNLIINGSAQVNQRVNCTNASKFPNDDGAFCLDHVLLFSDFDGDAVDVIQNSTAGVPPDGASHCFELDTETNDGKFGLLFPLENLVAAELFSAGDDRKCSIQFKYKATSGVQNIRAQVLSWTGTVDLIQDPVSDWEDLTADIDPTYVASWTPENSGTQIATTTDWQTYTLENIAIDTAGALNVALFIYVADIDLLAGTDKIYLADVHLNEGATVSNYVRPTYSQEFDECSRFFMKTFPRDTEPDDFTSIDGALVWVCTSGTNRRVGVQVKYPTPMPKEATVVFYCPIGHDPDFDTQGEWWNESAGTPQGEGAGAVIHGSEGGFYAHAPTATPSGNHIVSIHYTAVAEIKL